MKNILFIIYGLLLLAFQSQSIIDNYDIPGGGTSTVTLPANLNEISGLAVTEDGRLFGHGDERGIVYQINPGDGKIIKRFFLGRWLAEADFEDIAIAGKKFFMVTSDGKLYEFYEGENEKAVDYKVFESGASSKFDVEGLCFDPATNSLLIACKEYPGKDYKGYRTIYSYSLNDYKINVTPRFKIPIKTVVKNLDTKDFHPSGIERHPKSGNFFIIGSKDGEAVVEVDSSGNILGMEKLNKQHMQPEGITFLPDQTLIISDEKVKNSATLTLYKFQK